MTKKPPPAPPAQLPYTNPLAQVDPAFLSPVRPAMLTLNAPEPESLDRLLADRAALTTFLTHGLRLWRRAMSRTWEGPVDPADPTFGQKSNALARLEWLQHYQWLHCYGPTLLLLLDRVACEGAADTATRPKGMFDGTDVAPAAAPER